jgi:ATP-dependent Clp protease adapter protein ClpS
MTIFMTNKFRNPARPAIFFLSIFVMLSGFGVSSAVVGQEIYKSVDDDGNVTYSEQPPQDEDEATIIQSDPEPSAEEVESANQQLDQLVDDTNTEVQEVLQQQESQQQSASDDVTIEVDYQGVGVVGAPVVRRDVRKTHRRHAQRRK